MIKGPQIQALHEEGFHFITERSPSRRSMPC
jgi:hypothetical protein